MRDGCALCIARTHAATDPVAAMPSAQLNPDGLVPTPLLMASSTTPTTRSAGVFGLAVFHDSRNWARVPFNASKLVWVPQNFPVGSYASANRAEVEGGGAHRVPNAAERRQEAGGEAGTGRISRVRVARHGQDA